VRSRRTRAPTDPLPRPTSLAEKTHSLCTVIACHPPFPQRDRGGVCGGAPRPHTQAHVHAARRPGGGAPPTGARRRRSTAVRSRAARAAHAAAAVVVGGPPRGRRGRHTIVTTGRTPIRPHPKPVRNQDSVHWAFVPSVHNPRFPIQRVAWMGVLDRGQSKVIVLLRSTAVPFRLSSRSRSNDAISLGQLHVWSCSRSLLTVAPVAVPCAAPYSAARGRSVLFSDTTPHHA